MARVSAAAGGAGAGGASGMVLAVLFVGGFYLLGRLHLSKIFFLALFVFWYVDGKRGRKCNRPTPSTGVFALWFSCVHLFCLYLAVLSGFSKHSCDFIRIHQIISPTFPCRCIVFTLRHERKSRSPSTTLELIEKCRGDPQLMSTFLDALPAWLKFPTVERASWLNTILQQFWPHVDASLGDIVMSTNRYLADAVKPRFLDFLGLTKIYLGSHAPMITGLTRTTKSDKIYIDLDFLWSTDSFFEFAAVKSIFKFKFSLRNVHLKGSMRVTLGPFVAQLPCIRDIAVSFIRAPEVDFSFFFLGLDLMLLPLLQRVVRRKIIGAYLSNLMQWPRRLNFPLMDKRKAEKARKPCAGILRLHIVEGFALDSDKPYVVANLGRETYHTEVG